jgi:pseudaminic acid synthase
MKSVIEIKGRKIGLGCPPYIIAELSANHNGSLKHALKLIEAARDVGVDAVKLQTYTADTITFNSDKPDFLINEGLWKGHSLYELYKNAYTPWEWHQSLFNRAKELGLTIFSSPFDPSAVEFLEDLSCPAYKIASFEMVDHSLIEKAAASSKPVLISTGLASQLEIEEAVKVASESGCNELALFHCISGYPTPISEVNLLTMTDLARKYSLPVGFSDHTEGIVASISAVAMGASIIEKHFTIDKADGGYDSEFSLGKSDMIDLVKYCRETWEVMGEVQYELSESEKQNIKFRRSLYVVNEIKSGEKFSELNIRSIRPGYGLPPKYLKRIIGKVANKDIERGTALKWEHISEIE